MVGAVLCYSAREQLGGRLPTPPLSPVPARPRAALLGGFPALWPEGLVALFSVLLPPLKPVLAGLYVNGLRLKFEEAELQLSCCSWELKVSTQTCGWRKYSERESEGRLLSPVLWSALPSCPLSQGSASSLGFTACFPLQEEI